MINSMQGVLHLRYLCYTHERDADPLVVTTNQIGVVQNEVTPICYHERVSGSTLLENNLVFVLLDTK